VPLQLDQHEGVAGKECRPILDRTAEADAPIPEPGIVGLVPVQAEAMQRQRLVPRLQAGAGPVAHRSHRPEAIAIAGALARIAAANRLRRDKLGRTMVPRAQNRSGIGWRIKKLALERG
jgi:hypothetical protein